MKNSSLLLTLIILLSTSNFVAADSCNQVIEGNDMLQFNLKEMVVSSSCSDITVTLKHTGAMAANVMGHNWVLNQYSGFYACGHCWWWCWTGE